MPWENHFTDSPDGPGLPILPPDGESHSSSPSRQYTGVGPGLAIRRRLTAMMDGAGQGPASVRPCEAPLVLLVDDYADNRDVYAQFLLFAGVRVEEAEDGYQALAKAFALRPDVIVMDLALPGLDGWEATRRLKRDPRTTSIPIIALTGHVLPGHSQGAMDAGCDLFLTKPCLPERLIEEIRALLGGTASNSASTGR